MPRVANSGPAVDKWYDERQGDGSSTHDVCKDCNDELIEDGNCHNDKLTPYGTDEPQGEDGWIDGVYHPDYQYESDHGHDYHCAVCDKVLGEEDE